MVQVYIEKERYRNEIKDILEKRIIKNVFLVCGHSAEKLEVYSFLKSLLKKLGISCTIFQDFTSNPDYESVKRGISLFKERKCDFVIAIGGGSAMDVAKCVKTGCRVEKGGKMVTYQESGILFMAVPTTAGTGSEATQFAVIYYQGNKISAMCEDMLPQYVLLDGENLDTLPLLQKRVALADALCHAIESYWSVHSTEESKEYARIAMQIIMKEADNYFLGERSVQERILRASNYAGKAINLTKTTAAHAMSYKLTSLFGIPHGQAVLLCLPELWEYMVCHKKKCTDSRGEEYLEAVFDELAGILGCMDVAGAVEQLKNIRKKWMPKIEGRLDDKMIQYLSQTVNIERLGNTPVSLTQEDIKQIYTKIIL